MRNRQTALKGVGRRGGSTCLPSSVCVLCCAFVVAELVAVYQTMVTKDELWAVETAEIFKNSLKYCHAISLCFCI